MDGEVVNKEMMIITLRDFPFVYIPLPEKVYSFSFDDEPVVMLMEAA